MKIAFVEEKEKGKRYNAKIKVIGVGGAGGNALNNMIATKLQGVEFVAANTDSQNLERSSCTKKIQLGASITRGLEQALMRKWAACQPKNALMISGRPSKDLI